MSHTLRRGAIAAATLAVFLIAAPTAASAHVGVSPDRIPAGQVTPLTFSFSHGCGESPTTSLRVTMPKGIGSAWPAFDGDWAADVEKDAGGAITAVTFTAAQPVPVDLRGSVELAVITDKNAADELVFPVEQRCVSGTNEWTQVAKDGENAHDLDSPAPVVALTAADASGDHGQESAHGQHTAAPEASSSSSERPAAILPMLLGGGGLVIALAALVVSIRASRRRA